MMATMRAACVKSYGGPDQIEIRDVPRPEPTLGEVSIRVVATTVSSGDWRVRSSEVPAGMRTLMRVAMGWSAPRQPVLGTELVGVVDALGAHVSEWRIGDVVVAMPGAAMGAHAEFKIMPAAGKLIAKPVSLTFHEAAAMCFGGLTALHFLRARAGLQRGERLLVIGAAGAVGSAAVQLAHALGAEVTGVCSGANAALVAGLGAARVIDYTQTDYTTGGETYDVIMDTVGGASYATCRRVLRPRGRLLRVVAGLGGLLSAPFQGRAFGHRVIAGVSSERRDDMNYLAELAERGQYRPVIDGHFPFERIAEAHARVDSHHKRGSVVVDVSPAP
jgi:NADPH:quinone reductase-like Zn-dependent oxidoreductase